MSNISWVFDGIGTSIFTFVMGLIFGGTAGYKLAINKKTISQKQEAGDNSNQSQIGVIKNDR
ncbi:MAG: hypothetical protein V4478_01160 [Patescibacteria group bacterium]